MKIGKAVKIVTLPDAIPAQLPKVRRIPAPLWPVRKKTEVEPAHSQPPAPDSAKEPK